MIRTGINKAAIAPAFDQYGQGSGNCGLLPVRHPAAGYPAQQMPGKEVFHGCPSVMPLPAPGGVDWKQRQ